MFYIYLFIFWKNKYHSLSNSNSNFMIENSNNEIILKKDYFLMNNTCIKNNTTSELNNIQSYLKGDGSDEHWNQTEMDINTFIENKRKIGILNSLLSNTTSLPSKLSLIPEKEKIYKPNLFGGGFFKDSDFYF
jgi:hypothetical protein